jgi:transglutaminase-like putative cysteine protease
MSNPASNEDTKATRYCDFNHPAIQAMAEQLAQESGTPYRLALNTFTWVRDNIPFGFDFIKVKASNTLQKGFGACFNKSLLMLALLRANGIPARFCSVPVSRWFMKPYAGLQCALINNPFHHCLVHINLDGKWSFAEPALDQATYNALFKPLGIKWGIDWNQDRQDRLYLEHLKGEPKIHYDIDEIIDRNVENALLPAPIVRFFSNSVNRKAWAKVGINPLAA